jgi:hypothetical protein
MRDDITGMQIDAFPIPTKRFVDDDFPSSVECVLVDVDDRAHRFVEKLLVVPWRFRYFGPPYPLTGNGVINMR